MLLFEAFYLFYRFMVFPFSRFLHDIALIWMKIKKGIKMKFNSFIILFTSTVFGLVSYLLLNNSNLSLLILFTGSIFFYISKKNTHYRKENLNIIRDENKLYFYLSDDLLFNVDLQANRSISETLREAINREIATIKNITRKICFINFREDELLDELNDQLVSRSLY